MQIIKYVRKIKVPRWSSLIPFLVYIIFLLFILNVTFPIKSTTTTNSIDTSKTYIESNALYDGSQNKFNKHKIINENSPYNGILGIDNKDPDEDVIKNKDLQEKKKTAVFISKAIDGNDLLKTAFLRADTNKDKSLTIQELARYINDRIRDHIEMAIRTNPQRFADIDRSPRDGLISWEEYHEFFLRKRGLDENYIQNHSEKKHIKLDRKAKEEIMKDKALWNEAARTDSFSLTLDEFLTFRHPESSAANLLSLVDDLLRQFDEDGDDYLVIDEFSEVSADDLDDKWRRYLITKTVHERKEEFKRLIDTNKDGKADRSELLSYVDPRHPRYSLQEAATLFSSADQNNDQRLTLEEILNEAGAFIKSKMIGTSESFHDEF